ncbi:MAG: LysM peptidoglycan-binding domain-containing protein [Candidatus Saccharibacteria bacterium]|nr:LysM peptidoglycan-binding domain-containing protein [Candidatus Saccharibacteria bacterium]
MIKKRIGRSRKRIARYSLVGANIVLLIAVIGFITYEPASSSLAGQTVVRVSEEATERANPLDQLSSADIAVNVAMMADLEESVAVVNQADSVSANMAVTSSDESIATKPQLVTTDLKSKSDIVVHTVKRDETVSSVARKYGVTSDSIRWSNGIVGDALQVNQDLYVPPVNGIVYEVRSGDTVDSIAERYNANKAQLIADNDAELKGLKVGENILIRGGRKPAPTPTYSNYTFYRASYGGNGYIYGWCTWHAANRRMQTGNPLPTNLGNAATWFVLAQRAGLPVGDTPRAGAVIWHRNTAIAGGLGHVGYVEKVNPDGSILVSDMNFPIWGGVTYRTISPADFGSYGFVY